MKFGDRGQDVIEAQKFLIDNGFLKDKESYYSINTKNAVIKLQKELGLEPTGEYSKELRNVFNIKSSIPLRTTLKGGMDVVDETANSKYQAKFEESVVKQLQKIPCYIVNLITNNEDGDGIVYFPHLPEEFSYSKSNSWEETATKGRSEPFQGYSGSSGLSMDVSLTISADYAIGGNIDRILDRLEALAYPRYSDAGRIIPPKCFFRCASFSLEGILESVSISRRLPIINGRYSLADISLSFIETNANGISAKDVQDGKK